jgi:guanylate kinase
MIRCSPSLRRYIARNELPMRTSCDAFISGVTSYLAVTSWLDWLENDQGRSLPGGCEVLDHAEAPSQEAVHHAFFFAGGVVAKDPTYSSACSLAVVLAAMWRRVWPDAPSDDWLYGDWAAELGFCLAAEADGSGMAWEDNHDAHGLVYPGLEACSGDFFVKEESTCSDGAAMNRKRIIIVGPGGSGKDHLAKLMVPRGYRRAVSCTTRPPRKGETDGVEYHFITDREFRSRIDAELFREWYSFGVDNWLYGTLETEFQKADLFIMSPPVLETIGQETLDESVVVFLDIPVEIRRQRLEARADADSVERRLLADAADFEGFAAFNVRVTNPEFSTDDVLEALASFSAAPVS